MIKRFNRKFSGFFVEKYIKNFNLLINMQDWKKADEIYEKIKDKLKDHKGEIVAIEVGSGDYFVGKKVIDAYEKASKKYPKKEFYFMRIGSKYVYVVGGVKNEN